MAARDDDKLLSGESGQSLFEFMIFLPFLVAMLSFLVTVIGSINGAINQQKATRGYFYHVVKGNSTLPLAPTVDSLRSAGVREVGVYSIGWMVRRDGTSPVAPCYKINSMVAGGITESCDDMPDTDTRVSRFIKPATVYGMCGNAYILDANDVVYNHRGDHIGGTCTISQN